MPPIEYIPRTRELYKAHKPYRWVVNDDVPWTPFTKPIERCRVALVSSAGIFWKDQEPFHTKDDISIREIPINARTNDLRVSHFGYRTQDAEDDPNCVFPIDRMKDLEKEGFIGQLVNPAYSFMGGIYSVRKVRECLAAKLVRLLTSVGADLMYIVPA